MQLRSLWLKFTWILFFFTKLCQSLSLFFVKELFLVHDPSSIRSVSASEATFCFQYVWRKMTEWKLATRFHVENGHYDCAVTKVTVHLPPTAAHLLGQCTLPPRALLLSSSDPPDEVRWDEVKRREDENKIFPEEKMKMNSTRERRWRRRCRLFWTIRTVY